MVLFLDILAIFSITAMGVVGFKRGLVEELGRLLGLIAAATIAWNYYIELSGFVLTSFKVDPWVVMVFCYAIIFTMVILIMRLLTSFVHLLLLSKSTTWLNHSMGFVFGALKATLVVMIFLWALAIAPNAKWSRIIHEQSTIAAALSQGRLNLITFFNMADPVKESETLLQELLEKAASEL